MEILPLLFFCLFKFNPVSCLVYTLNKFKSEFTIGKSVLDKQLVSGYVEIKEETFNQKDPEQKYLYELLVYNEENSKIFYLRKLDVKINEKVSFSFTTAEKQNVTVKLIYRHKPIQNKKLPSNKYFPAVGKVKVEINSDYDFFNQKVVEKQFTNPVSRLMMNYMGALQVSANKYTQMDKEIEESITQFKWVFSLVFGLAVCIFCAFLGVNIWQAKRIRDHFKQKKLI